MVYYFDSFTMAGSIVIFLFIALFCLLAGLLCAVETVVIGLLFLLAGMLAFDRFEDV